MEPRNLLAGDLIAHWVADDLNPSIADGESIPAWVDNVGGVTASALGTPVLAKNVTSGRSFVQFDPSDDKDYFRVAASESPLSGANDFSIAVVIRTDSMALAGGDGQWYENTAIVDANRRGFANDWGISINADGRFATGVGAGSFVDPATSVSASESGSNDGQLHLVTVTRSGSELAISVDGNVAASTNSASSASRDNIDITFGVLQQDKDNPFSGGIAEIRFYNGALSSGEIATLTGEINTYYNNVAPTAVADAYTFTEDPPFFHLVSAADGVLANDTDQEGDALKAFLVTPPANGNLALNDDGSFTYAPLNNFFGTDQFTYTANDAQASEPTTVVVEVTNVYDPPSPADDRYKLLPTATLQLPGIVGILSNDANPDRNTLLAVLDSGPEFGTASLSPDGALVFDPQGQAGVATLQYRIDDQTGNGQSAVGTVTLVVNTPPQAVADTWVVSEDTPLVRTAAEGIVANDSDADGDPLVVSLIEAPANGVLMLEANGAFEFVPNENFFGEDSFRYQLSDGEDTSEIVAVQLTVQAVNDPPVGEPDTYFTPTNQTLTIDGANGLLLNDSDVENDPLTVAIEQAPQAGTLQLRSDGSFDYQPNPDYVGVDAFTYRLNDGQDASLPVTVNLLVGQPPVQISEFMAANASLETSVRDDVDGRFPRDKSTPDWIELANLTDAALNIAGYHLTDNRNVPTKWTFPSGTTIPRDGHLLVFASRMPTTDPALDENGALHTNFKLDVTGEYLAVVSPSGQVIHEFTGVGQQRADVSYGIAPDGTAGLLRAATPGAANSIAGKFAGIATAPVISRPRGFYNEPFEVSITSPEPAAKIFYTLDGNEPTAETGTLYETPIAVTTTTVLKAIVDRDGYVPSVVNAQSYLFPEAILRQDNSGPAGATNWGHASPDYEMDPEIVNHADPEIRPVVEDLLRIPTVSVAIDTSLFLGSGGIYIAGENVERPITFEYFDPNSGDAGVQTNSTIQIVGGSSPQRWKSDKLSMRVRFTEDAGESELNYPLFGADAATAFDTLVLDARLNNVWHYGGGSDPNGQRGRAQYMRDEFAADLQNSLGGYATHGQHVHVYINGIYWGMHTLHERPDENFQATYQGGVAEDYNVIKHTAGEVINGSNESYLQLNAIFNDGGETVTDAEFAQVAELLDVDDFIKYMQANFYGGNGDWDHHNWYASQNPLDGKWRFHSWDAEKFLENVRQNATTTNNRNAPTGMHRRLMTNEEYALTFADHVQANFYDDGPMTPTVASELYKWRSDQIDLATRVESARWGDNQRANPYVRPDWVNVRDDLFENYFPQRTETVVSQFEARGWFQSGQAAAFEINGAAHQGGYINTGSRLTMTAAEGTILYTIDGTDPRVAGGGVSANAIAYEGELPVNATIEVAARVQLADGSWSPIRRSTFRTSVPASDSNLRISEIYYHPSDATDAESNAGFSDADEFEFIELVNVSDQTIDLSQVGFHQVVVGNDVQGIRFSFAAAGFSELQPGERVVVVENAEAFAMRYGTDPKVAGVWSGGLSNNSERIQLKVGETVIADVTYDDAWYVATDGGGASLQIVDELGDLATINSAAAWRVSSRLGGTPGASDNGRVVGDSNGDNIFSSSDLVLVFQAGKYEDAIPQNATFEEGDWNGDGDFTTADLVFAFQNGTYVAGAQAAHRLAPSAIADSLFSSPLDRSLRINKTKELTAENVSDLTGLETAQLDRLFASDLERWV